MKTRFMLASAFALAFVGTAAADEYYVVTSPTTHRCTITTTKPADREVVTPLAFKSREEAETRMKTVKTCEEDGVSGGGSSGTTIIKEK
jgi:hypothetical protein